MAISFNEVSNSSGIIYQGESYGVSWGDYNGDGLPDLWTTNHLAPATLYLNQGNGTFTDITSQAFNQSGLINADLHGAQWADFDNDGDLDLLQEAASDNANGVNILFVNENGTLINRASALGIDIPTRGRTPLWFDFDRDGSLDMLINGARRETAPPTVFRQNESGVFENANSLTGFDLNSTSFGILSDLTGDGILDLIVDGRTVYDTNSLPFDNVSNDLFGNLIDPGVTDATAADFNGDLLPDLYLTRRGAESDIFQDSSNSFNAYFRNNRDEKGVQFSTTGDVTFELATNANFLSVSDIKIGASGFSPSDFDFTLSPDDPNVQGIAPHDPGDDLGVFIGFDPSLQQWQILSSRPDRRPIYAFVDGEEPISQTDAIGFDPNNIVQEDQLLINTGSGFVDASDSAGITDIATASESVVSGDFDNDMDVDIYVVNTGLAGNRENTYYENQGDGTFTVVADANGAAGTSLGLGDVVTTVDYDEDGFLDLFVANGNFFAGLGAVSREFYNDAPYELFQSQGNGNNWLEVDLEGVLSNRDGIGAQVFATTRGVTQLREQNGGMHEYAQNFQRLHFGLANNNTVNLLEVRWTNGVVQRLRNISANQIVNVVEGVGLNGNDSIDGSVGNDTLIGNAGNDRLRGFNGNDSLEGGSGNDRIFGNQGNDILSGGLGNDNIVGGNDEDLLFGDEGNDRLVGQAGNDTVDGGDGDDRIFGNGGIDFLQGRGGNDTINGGGNQDRLFGNEGADLLNGQGGNDTLDGGSGNDTLTGGSGNDLLIGEVGNDTMTGDAGRDRFRFLTPADGVDNIIDFGNGNDKLEFASTGFGGLSAGILPAEQFVLGNAAQDSDDRFIYNQDTGNLFYDEDGVDGNNSVFVAVLSNQAGLSANDIVII